MAPSRLLLSLSILLGFLSFSSSARPCKTLFISSYSFSLKPLNPNPNNPSSGFVIVTEIHEDSIPASSLALIKRRFVPFVPSNNYENTNKGFQGTTRRDEVGSVWDGFGSYDLSSLRDRTKDILSVVVALLFGVGCGALTAATMYLVWSLFSPSQSRYDDYFDGEFSDEEEEDLKKIGYVKIPEAEQVKGGSGGEIGNEAFDHRNCHSCRSFTQSMAELLGFSCLLSYAFIIRKLKDGNCFRCYWWTWSLLIRDTTEKYLIIVSGNRMLDSSEADIFSSSEIVESVPFKLQKISLIQ
ncbi:hypothetical protein OIU85_007802 [Salix viminalis]|uniref:Uncharacterized protein n=1 Tax=Salix viminalis TaxID=40686 RepID=A0A9Q0P9L6_SALVM|nr:hypothetical protein OIU85_007802 [Salix viminalis]